jgi:hypothetical protein
VWARLRTFVRLIPSSLPRAKRHASSPGVA